MTVANDPLEPVAEVGLRVMDAGWPWGVSVSVSCTLTPFQVAVIVAVFVVATCCVVRGSETLELPAATVATAGTITSGVSLDNVMEAPPAGAAPFNPMIASGWALPLMMLGVIISVLSEGGSTLSWALELPAFNVAVMLTGVDEVTCPDFIWNCVQAVFAGITIVAGTGAAVGSELFRLIVAPLGPAAVLSCICTQVVLPL